MTIKNKPIAVLGCGSWGTALAIHLANNACSVRLWGRKPDLIAAMQSSRCNTAYLPESLLPESLQLFADLEQCLAGVRDIFIVVPSQGFAQMLARLKQYAIEGCRIVWGTKGLVPDTGECLHQLVYQQFGEEQAVAVVSGPSFAKEVAQGLPTAISIAGNNDSFIDDMVERLHGPSMRVYKNSDLVGVQLCAVLKNVLAIAVGMSDGLGLGANTRAAIITRGIAEMSRLLEALGAEQSTLMGLAGVGDTLLTCTDNQSRNRRFGLALGEGNSIAQAFEMVEQEVEGAHNVSQVHALAEKHHISMPISEQVYAVIKNNVAVREAMAALLSRKPASE